MPQISQLLVKIKTIVILTLLFLTPLFFLPTTQEFFITNKIYLLAFGSLFLILISALEFLVTKKLVWRSSSFDRPIFLLFLSVALSILISAPNKVQALLNPNFGLIVILPLTVLYYYISRSLDLVASSTYLFILNLSSLILSVIAIIYFFQPFKNAHLPQVLQFLTNGSFTPIGSQLDLAIFLGFVLLWQVGRLIKTKPQVTNLILTSLTTLGFLLTTYTLWKDALILTPLRLSWFAAVETLKNPLTALFGVGVDNFGSMFTKVKDLAYNQTPLWQTSYFNVSRSAILHVFSEAGLVGLIALLLIFFQLAKEVATRDKLLGKDHTLLAFIGLVVVYLAFPPSLIVFFLLFVFAALVSRIDTRPVTAEAGPLRRGEGEASAFDVSQLLPLYASFLLITALVVLGLGYLLARSYVAEYDFKKSLDAIGQNNLQNLYNYQRDAVIADPFIERFHINFSQTNLLIANNVASRANQSPSSAKTPAKAPQLSDQDRAIISQAVQAAIAEAKSAVALNPQRSTNWENLAIIYRNILAVAQGADVWTVSSYQRAILADPQNPAYRLNLGGVYYSLQDYTDAQQLFQQSASLKPDWANAHYNLAWAAFQQGNYQLAVNEMQNVLSLISPQSDPTDYQKAQKDFATFKAKLPETQTQPATQSAQPQLTLPSPAPTLQPKLNLPKTASPEAK